MSDRTETTIVVLVLAAAGLVMLAPLVGRAGAAGAADVVMTAAAACGVGAFALAGGASLRAARRAGSRGRDSRGHSEGSR